MAMYQFRAIGASVIGLLTWANPASAQDMASSHGTPSKCEGSQRPSTESPAPADPYPLMAAGWGPEVGNGLLYSRWAEDWTGMRKAGNVPAFKAMPLYGEATLTLSSEARLRYDASDNGQLTLGNDYQQALFRGIFGADLRFNPTFRLYGQVCTGPGEGRRRVAPEQPGPPGRGFPG